MAKRPMASTQFKRMHANTLVIKRARGFFTLTVGIAVGFVVLATAFPQRVSLIRLEKKLEMAKARQQLASSERDQRMTEFRALRDDPSFLEIQARDRLDCYREGERVLKFRKMP